MKKIISFLLLIIAFCGNAQTVTPHAGQSTASLQAVQINTLLTINNSIKSNSVVSISSGTVSPTSFTMALTPSSVTASGTVSAGARWVLFETSFDFQGTINTEVFQANGFLQYPPISGGQYPAIPYTVTAGTLIIRRAD